jgi:hypothetical protein
MGWVKTFDDEWHNIDHIIRFYVADVTNGFGVFFDGVDGDYHIHKTFALESDANEYLKSAFGDTELHFSPGPFVICKNEKPRSNCY